MKTEKMKICKIFNSINYLNYELYDQLSIELKIELNVQLYNELSNELFNKTSKSVPIF